MAVYTQLGLADARALASAHGLPSVDRIEPIPAGSVNSNFFVIAGSERWFLRIYEEQDVEGIAYEHALLDHLLAAGLPVPGRIPGPPPGAMRVAGKPVGLFEVVGGTPSCQASVSPSRAAAVGRFLAEMHEATSAFPERRAGRFRAEDIVRKIAHVRAIGPAELARAVSAVERALSAARAFVPDDVGPIHGDLFRDNVRFEGDRIVAAIDWESASDGARVYDLAVTVLAWCYDDGMRWDLARSMCEAYVAAHSLPAGDRRGFRCAALAAAARFTTTRITDFHLRAAVGARVEKDYRRFLARLEAMEALSDDEVAERVGL